MQIFSTHSVANESLKPHNEILKKRRNKNKKAQKKKQKLNKINKSMKHRKLFEINLHKNTIVYTYTTYIQYIAYSFSNRKVSFK